MVYLLGSAPGPVIRPAAAEEHVALTLAPAQFPRELVIGGIEVGLALKCANSPPNPVLKLNWPNSAVPSELVRPYHRSLSPFRNQSPCQLENVVENQVPAAVKQIPRVAPFVRPGSEKNVTFHCPTTLPVLTGGAGWARPTAGASPAHMERAKRILVLRIVIPPMIKFMRRDCTKSSLPSLPVTEFFCPVYDARHTKFWVLLPKRRPVRTMPVRMSSIETCTGLDGPVTSTEHGRTAQ